MYRFGQVPIRTDDPIDWSASCGNMISAAALSALTSSIIPYSTLFMRSRTLPRSTSNPYDEPLMFPISILSASNGVLMRAKVPIHPISLQVWEPKEGEGCEIAGVPGKNEPGVEVEMPLEMEDGAEAGLVTGRTKDTVTFDDGSEVSRPCILKLLRFEILTRFLMTGDRFDSVLWITQHFPSPLLPPLPAPSLTTSQSPNAVPFRTPLHPFFVLDSLLNPYPRSNATFTTSFSRISEDHYRFRYPSRGLHHHFRNDSQEGGSRFACSSDFIWRLARYNPWYDIGCSQYRIRNTGYCRA